MLPRLANLSSFFSIRRAAAKPENSSRTQYSIFLVTISPGKFIDFPLVGQRRWEGAWRREGNQEKEAARSASGVKRRIETRARAENDARRMEVGVERCCAKEGRREGRKEGRKEGRRSNEKLLPTVSPTTTPLQSLIKRHVDTFVRDPLCVPVRVCWVVRDPRGFT